MALSPTIRRILLVDLLLTVFILAWLHPFAQRQRVPADGWEQLIPSDRIDPKVECMDGNNNLDVVEFDGRFYIAFRTAPSHFASSRTKLYIISSDDLETWEYEHEVHLGYDMREPRFAVFQDTLRLYFFEGGKKRLRFEPRHMWVTTCLGPGRWSECVDMALDGYVNWRLRVRDDTLYLSAYYGKDLYNSAHKGSQRLFYSTDGYDFKPISESPQVPDHGVEEGEFIFDKDGNIWGTLRMEGDGAMVFYAPADDIANWKTRYTKHKYDSALLFEHNGEFYLVSRRNLDGTAAKSNIRTYNLVRYSFTRKRTAIYHFNREKLSIDWIADFPSTGDTAFPGIAPLGDGKYFLINYSSDIHGKEKSWIRGQLGKTYIYSTILDMDELLKNR